MRSVKTIAATFMMACLLLSSVPVLADSTSGNGPNVSKVYQDPASGYYVYLYVPQKVVPVYRFYCDYKKDYFWTTSSDEKEDLQKMYKNGTETYQYQGIVGYAEETASDRNTPVYRFWNKKTTDHFYTTSSAEKKQLEKDYKSGEDDYKYEGVAWYVPKDSGKPVYRFFDTKNFNHYYTSSEDIRASLQTAYTDGTGTYRYEGIAWYWYE